ncbi:hypothetical protein FF125_02425 [Aureibaculum algae]|uniref:Uncharacterized protein n=1 Tax=Aureibaculum algae TaxID=2584122 RepID=A0A5B7TQY0_9FLAO|nr:hypothetical protein [Aureibaculum algae]QCX37347.1 hypothetical protein FF125_02425 [Aureibaculum algae]
MKIQFYTIMFFVFFVSCTEKKKSKQEDSRNVEHITTDDKIIGDFDREKYPILQNAILLKLDGKFNDAIIEFKKAEAEYGKMIPIF